GRALLIIGALLLAWVVAYIGASIPSSTSALRGQGQFLQLCLLPLLVSLVCLTIYWSWWPERHPRRDFVLFGALVHVAAWAGYTVWLRTPWGLRRPRGGSRAMALVAGLLELLFVVLVGAAGGGLAWLVATSLFPDPGGGVLLYASFGPAGFPSAFVLAATLLVGLLGRWAAGFGRYSWA